MLAITAELRLRLAGDVAALDDESMASPVQRHPPCAAREKANLYSNVQRRDVVWPRPRARCRGAFAHTLDVSICVLPFGALVGFALTLAGVIVLAVGMDEADGIAIKVCETVDAEQLKHNLRTNYAQDADVSEYIPYAAIFASLILVLDMSTLGVGLAAGILRGRRLEAQAGPDATCSCYPHMRAKLAAAGSCFSGCCHLVGHCARGVALAGRCVRNVAIPCVGVVGEFVHYVAILLSFLLSLLLFIITAAVVALRYAYAHLCHRETAVRPVGPPCYSGGPRATCSCRPSTRAST